jgi:glutathione S-transferase|tara:strand:+ start:1217 stop:1864 length:648 start_codon:yes stop_codon:yes gene_type:complete
MQIYAMGIQDELSFDLPVQFMMGKMYEVSPIGRIPVLEVDEGLIPESEVIAEYLDERFPDKALTGGSLKARADVRVVSRMADIYLMNNIFMSLSQANQETRVQAVLDLLIGQVKRGIGALEKHIGDGEFAVGDSLTRADCSLVPALWMCSSTVPRLGFDSPILEGTRVSAYWDNIQHNEFAAKILDEMDKGMKARLDGTERKMAEEAIARARANQ